MAVSQELAEQLPEPELSDNALRLLERRYLRKNENGEACESAKEMFLRVAEAVAEAEREYELTVDVDAVSMKFYQLMVSLDFLPNSPTLMNAGTGLGQLSACFVLPVEDDMASIFDAVRSTALIHQSGGGTGFSFSRLRPAGDVVRSTGGVASGPISFMKVFDAATDVIKQGGRRRGANMGVLRVDHPDIIDFIECKSQEGILANFNISVAVTDEFMRAVERGESYSLVNPRTGRPTSQLDARDVFKRIVEGAWRNGEPGIIFIDRMNRLNPTPQLGEFESTNPCGEQVLLPNESCNLGSINLSHMVADGRIDWERLRSVVYGAVHFLDNVITANRFPLPQIREATLLTRKIGLGVMGFADLLFALGISYDSDEAEAVAHSVMEAIAYWSKEASVELATHRGSFPAYSGSMYERGDVPFPTENVARMPEAPEFDWDGLKEEIAKKGIRNATTTTIAPTGSISFIAGCSSGIEPVFALAFTRNVLNGQHFTEMNPVFERVIRERGLYSDDLMKSVAEAGRLDGTDVPDDLRRVFVTAHDVAPEWHVRIQAAFQRFTDNAVSKTINFPNEATVEDVSQAYRLAYELGCKGITVYRDGSRQEQVLTRGAEDKHLKKSEDGDLRPRPRPSVTRGTTEKVTLGCGRKLYITINEDDVGLCEVFLLVGKSGGCTFSQSESVGRLISLALRSGIDVEAVIKQLKGIRCPFPSWHNGGVTLSCADAIAKALERYVGLNGNRTVSRSDMTIDLSPECPDCGSLVEFKEGCVVCPHCGYSQCS